MADRPWIFDRESPLERSGRESLRANQALRDYALMGPGRSLRKLLRQYREQSESRARALAAGGLRQPGESLAEPPTLREASLMTWSAAYAWQERVATWDALLDAQVRARWSQRKAEQVEKEWQFRDALFDLAFAILAESPNYHKTTRRVVKATGQEIVTVALDAALALQAGELASKLGRAAAGLPTNTSHVEHSGSLALPQPGLSNFADLPDDELNHAIDNILLASLAEGAAFGGADREAAPPEPPDAERAGEPTGQEEA